jgi:hypothetical protein
VKTGLLSAVCAIGVFLLVLVGTVLYVFSQGKPECDGVCLESWNAGWASVISALCGLAAGAVTWRLARNRTRAALRADRS